MNPPSSRDQRLLRRIRWLVSFFIVGLVLSGATAIPIESELNWLVKFTGARTHVERPGVTEPPAWAEWLCRVQAALHNTNTKYPFIGYGGDWLAFGHFAIDPWAESNFAPILEEIVIRLTPDATR